jgi:hypothetical protein
MKTLLRSVIVALVMFGAYAAYSLESGPHAIPGTIPAPSCPRPQ